MAVAGSASESYSSRCLVVLIAVESPAGVDAGGLGVDAAGVSVPTGKAAGVI